ncbi:glycosyltransferase [uncultured Kordia sp.]|uniref:glycosyltransferase n=1 Tax=uncultured Kordia sp. TaxID=507699 RepID=UPI002628F32D|nr:glycosyltransferase [uncultured Kordia sp.]
MRKKIISIFIGFQSFENHYASNFFDIPEEFDMHVWHKVKSSALEKLPKSITTSQLPNFDYNGKTDFLRYLKAKATLRYNDKVQANKNHLLYRVAPGESNLKKKLKFSVINLLSIFYASKKGIQKLEDTFFKYTRESSYYKECLAYLTTENPDLIYCSHQVSSLSLAPVVAARDLGIKVVSFIHSWDNLPKGNKMLKADHYYVWSEYMKEEMQQYYPDEVKNDNITVTGTPQFTFYTKSEYLIPKELFYKTYKLPLDKKLLCFSGNFTSIGMDDPLYLKDLAESVKAYNEKNKDQYHVILRANPADYNQGFVPILKQYKDVITEVIPTWNTDENPLPISYNVNSNLGVLYSTLYYSEAIFNIGSTMALDAILLKKLAFYCHYNQPNGHKDFNIDRLYQFVHFKTFDKHPKAVHVLRSTEDIKNMLYNFDTLKLKNMEARQNWAESVAAHPLEKVQQRMHTAFKKLLS